MFYCGILYTKEYMNSNFILMSYSAFYIVSAAIFLFFQLVYWCLSFMLEAFLKFQVILGL